MTPPSHNNQFDKIRILAALMVIYSHHFPLAGHTAPSWLLKPWNHWAWMGGIGVMIFFTISGYLVTQSWYRQPHFGIFLGKRILRLWPGMLGSVLACVFLFGLAFTALPAGQFLLSPATWQFVFQNLTLVMDNATLPEVFQGKPYAGVINGVYWTIPLEFMCYVVLACLGLLGLMRSRRLLTIGGLAYIAYFFVFANVDFTHRDMRHWIEYPAYFVAGGLIALHNDWFLRHGKKLLLVLAPVLVLFYVFTPYMATSRFLLLPLLVIWVGNLRTLNDRFSRLGDPSYGIYLFGYPIARTLLATFPEMNFWLNMLLTFALSIAAGYASWWLLESRALRLKRLFTPR